MLRTPLQRAALIVLGILTLVASSAAAHTMTAPPLQAGAVTVYVSAKPGETLWGLAARWCGAGQQWPRLAQASGIADPRRMRIGQRVVIPCARSGSLTSSASYTPRPPGAWVHPLPGAECTSSYGWRPAIWRGGRLVAAAQVHQGVDLLRPAGTRVRAAHAGTVVRSGWWMAGYGISVLVDHGAGRYTHYAHLSRSLVAVGQQLALGQALGLEGATGQVTGAHLHFEVWGGWKRRVNPTPYLAAHGIRTGCQR